MKPQFSVIIPTFHEESALDGTLRSLYRATNGHPIETIVVDGGSTDKTLDIAGKYTSNIHVLKERGIALARNYGASKASGDVLIFLDSDTKVPGDFFDELSRIFRNPGVAGANCNVMPCPTSKPSRNEKLFYRMWGKTRKVFYKMKPCGTGDNGIIVRSHTFNKAGGFDESMNTMEDLDFIFRASKLGRFLFLKDLTLTESMRRIRKEGLPRFSAIYIYNFLYYMIKRKPRVSQWEPIR